MSQLTDGTTASKTTWKTPTFQVIPISFEASSYALTGDEQSLDPVIA